MDCNIINEENDIAVVVKKRHVLNISDGIEEVESVISHLKEISSEYNDKGKKIAVWGAGHRTLALLALSQLDTIEYIIDSAKFKQGKFSPVIHTPIIACIHIKKIEKKPAKNKFLFAIKPYIKVTIDKPMLLKLNSPKTSVG